MSKQQLEKVETLYDEDFFRWTQETAELIRRRRFDEVDVEHVAEEIEDMGKRDHREVRSRLIVLVMHLLKWQLQPEHREKSTWVSTINQQHAELDLVLEDSPSLRHIPKEQLPFIYRNAVERAIRDTGLSRKLFPSDCPYTPEQILDYGFLPEGPLAPRV
jgi:hypothetical protein